MGKKHRRKQKNNKGDDDDLEYDPEGANHENENHEPPNAKSLKCLTFAEKREIRQQQAAQKRKAKQRCYLCGEHGHVRRECPGIADDGRGMSRYKGKSDPKGEKMKRELEKERMRKEREEQQNKVDDGQVNQASYFETVEFPEGFIHQPEDGEDAYHHQDPDEIVAHQPDEFIPHYFFDPHCRVLESIEYMQTQQDAKKAKNKKQNNPKNNNSKGKGKDPSDLSTSSAMREYQAIWNRVLGTTNFSGVIVPTTVQMLRPWSNPIPWLDSGGSEHFAADEGEPSQQQEKAPRKVPIFFALGLASTVSCATDVEQVEAKQLLLETIEANEQREENFKNPIEALWVTLDYTKPKRTREAQRKRLECLLEVAHETRRTLQAQVLPGIPHDLTNLESSVAGTAYAQVLLDFQETLSQHLQRVQKDASDVSSSPRKGLLRVHMVGWQGRSDHTLSLLKAFAPKGPFPCNLFIGLDPTVTFSKATHLHELAFEIPLDRLVLETGQIIPSPITKRLGRQAAPHVAWWPFVAEAVAKYSKQHDMKEVASVSINNIAQLYPNLEPKLLQLYPESDRTLINDTMTTGLVMKTKTTATTTILQV